jgi:hypothetical protein
VGDKVGRGEGIGIEVGVALGGMMIGGVVAQPSKIEVERRKTSACPMNFDMVVIVADDPFRP